MMHIRYLAGLLFVCLLLPYSIIYSSQQSGEKTAEVGFFRINPLNSLTLGWVNLSTTYPVERYTFPNQDGTFADKGSNFYLIGTGDGGISSFIDFNYDLRLNTIEGARFKKGSVFFRSNSISLEVGRNNIWFGSGQYGSLLLSNNAEPFTLVRFRTERPFNIPYIGSFHYTLFHGWPRNFNIFGHKLSWLPISWLEFNIKQTNVYSGKYKFIDYLKMFTGREANIKNELGKTDSRASFGTAVSLNFISNLSNTISDIKLYLEFGGEDLYAKWQVSDAYLDKDLWIGPFGFQLLDTGLLSGLAVSISQADIFLEYAQNYKNHYIFYDPYKGMRPYNVSWYRHTLQPPFKNNGAIMGHHMGSSAEMLSLHYRHSFSHFSTSIIMSRRHRWNIILGAIDLRTFKEGPAERQDSFLGLVEYHYNRFSCTIMITYNMYKNADINPSPVINTPVASRRADEVLFGLVIKMYI